MTYSRRLFFAISFFLTYQLANAQVFINEWMAANTSFLADDFGEYDDWIEIYNPTGSAFDLGGLYMSDDPADLIKWQLPTDAGTALQVPAFGFLILWADNDSEQGPTHLEFKLSGSGESIVLIDSDGTTIIDQVNFSAQGNDISYGRFPDGATDFEFFPTPTPSAANISGGNVTFPLNINIPINTGSDDASEFFGQTLTEKNPQNIGVDGGVAITAGFRFTNITLDKSATIDEAYIQFTSHDDQSVPANFEITMVSDIYPETMVTGPTTNISTRNYLSETVNWEADPWTTGESGAAQQSASLIPLIEAWIGQPGWQSGSSAFFKITGTGIRNAYSFDGDDEMCARLIINGNVTFPNTPASGLVINEIAAAGTTHRDTSQKAEDWVELYNNGAGNILTTGLFLTDDPGNLDKWNLPFGRDIPPGGFIKFFLDSDPEEGPNHANFNLRSRGEWLGLVQQTNTGLVILDSLIWDEIPFMSTYGRQPDGSGTFNLLGDFTPETSNNDARLYLAPPTIGTASGVYQTGPNVVIDHSVSGTDFYYTLDGNPPTTSSLNYGGAISINDNAALSVIATKSGYAPSQPVVASYLIDEPSNLPIIFLTTAPDNFFDDENGIYVDGTNGVVGFCSPVPVNWAQNWERPSNVQLVYPDGSLGFNSNAGVKISGACSRNFPMKSLAITTKEQEYGTGKFSDYLFPERDHNDFYELKIRNSGQDYLRMGFRDLLNQKLIIGNLDLELQAGITTQLYINGEFWGIYNLREKYTTEYFDATHGVNPNKIDIIKSPALPYMEIKEGKADDFMDLFNWIENANLANTADFDLFSEQVDINNFINYWTTMTILGNYDWPSNNLTVWKETKASGKWRYCVADTDGSTNNFLSQNSADRPFFNTLDIISIPWSQDWPNHKFATRLIRKAWENTDFANEYAQRACSIMDMIFPVEIVSPALDSMTNLFDPHVERILERWNNVDLTQPNPLGGNRFSWEDWIEKYRDYFIERPDHMRSHLMQKFGYSGTYQLTFGVDADTKGKVEVNWNEMEVPFNHMGTYFQSVPLRVKAIPNQGFSFVEWLETGVTDSLIEYVSASNATLTPIFEASCTVGASCDDGDNCTENDVFDEACNCKGTFADADNDSICDDEDECPGFDDTIDINGDGVPDCLVSISEIDRATAINIFPNPSNGELMIEIGDQLIGSSVKLNNYLGQQIQTIEVNKLDASQLSLKCDSCEEGIYYLSIETVDGRIIQEPLMILKN